MTDADGLDRAGGQHGGEQVNISVSVLPAADAVRAFGLLAGGVGADRRALMMIGRCSTLRVPPATVMAKRSRPRGAGPPFFSPTRLYCEPWHGHSNHCEVRHYGTRQPRCTHFW